MEPIKINNNKALIKNLPVNVKASAFIKKGKKALIFVSNLGDKVYKTSGLKLDLKKFNIEKFEVYNGETRTKINLNNPITIKKHDFLLLEVEVGK